MNPEFTKADLKKAFEAGVEYESDQGENGNPFRPSPDFKKWYREFIKRTKITILNKHETTN
jgi:hypothetical protein